MVGEVGSFEAVSPSSVAWQIGGQKNEIWLLNFETKAPVKIWESTTNKLEGFTYTPGRG